MVCGGEARSFAGGGNLNLIVSYYLYSSVIRGKLLLNSVFLVLNEEGSCLTEL